MPEKWECTYMRKILLLILLIGLLGSACQAKTIEQVQAGHGIGNYSGWIVADMTENQNGKSNQVNYSINIYKKYNLIPVAYCSSGGSHLGTYYTYYVNPTNNSLIVGRMGLCPHGQVFNSTLKAYSESGLIVEYTDLGPNQELYRKIIAIGKTEVEKYKKSIS